ncbi:DUF4113 domain-containing protein [Xanthomonas campestris]|uniref:DUF4113 domain-containing protein n=1 Tax=Xanthomonas campestris TaxID=339 RepID=UPI003D021A72
MATMDRINQKFGRAIVGLGTLGWQARPAWAMRQYLLSPTYKTPSEALPHARCCPSTSLRLRIELAMSTTVRARKELLCLRIVGGSLCDQLSSINHRFVS